MTSSSASDTIFIDHLETQFCQAIYGSNNIEDAGIDEITTHKLCKQTLRGEPIQNSLKQGDPEYRAIEVHLRADGQFPDSVAVARARLEVIQHAQAFKFLIERVVLEGQDLTYDLILETHKIFFSDIRVEGELIGGRIRKHEVAARYGTQKKARPFIRAVSVYGYMQQLFQDLHDEVSTGRIDAYDLATKYAHRFVNIHPFTDGNGRVKRMVMNVLLLK